MAFSFCVSYNLHCLYTSISKLFCQVFFKIKRFLQKKRQVIKPAVFVLVAKKAVYGYTRLLSIRKYPHDVVNLFFRFLLIARQPVDFLCFLLHCLLVAQPLYEHRPNHSLYSSRPPKNISAIRAIDEIPRKTTNKIFIAIILILLYNSICKE